MALTDKQAAFVREYVKDFNATAAAGRAGYSDPNYGRQLLTNPNVAEELARINNKAETEAVMSLREVQEWWSNLIRGPYDVRDKLKAAADLSKSLGGDKLDITSGGDKIDPIHIYLPSNGRDATD